MTIWQATVGSMRFRHSEVVSGPVVTAALTLCCRQWSAGHQDLRPATPPASASHSQASGRLLSLHPRPACSPFLAPDHRLPMGHAQKPALSISRPPAATHSANALRSPAYHLPRPQPRYLPLRPPLQQLFPQTYAHTVVLTVRVRCQVPTIAPWPSGTAQVSPQPSSAVRKSSMQRLRPHPCSSRPAVPSSLPTQIYLCPWFSCAASDRAALLRSAGWRLARSGDSWLVPHGVYSESMWSPTSSRYPSHARAPRHRRPRHHQSAHAPCSGFVGRDSLRPFFQQHLEARWQQKLQETRRIALKGEVCGEWELEAAK